jgi:hypothetical protein
MTVESTVDKKATHVTDSTLNDQGKAWSQLNHSVLVVGWGYDE